jgi:hypothetical protein
VCDGGPVITPRDLSFPTRLFLECVWLEFADQRLSGERLKSTEEYLYGHVKAAARRRYRPLAAVGGFQLSGSNAAGPVIRGHSVNSRSRPHSGHPGAREIVSR